MVYKVQIVQMVNMENMEQNDANIYGKDLMVLIPLKLVILLIINL